MIENNICEIEFIALFFLLVARAILNARDIKTLHHFNRHAVRTPYAIHMIKLTHMPSPVSCGDVVWLTSPPTSNTKEHNTVTSRISLEN